MDGYSEAEIVAARASAQYMGILETPEADDPLVDTDVVHRHGNEGGPIEAAGSLAAKD